MDIGSRLSTLRKQYGYTQNGLAEKAGLSQTHLRRVELGQADITVNHLEFICDAMNISLKDFFDIDTSDDKMSKVIAKLSPKQKNLLTEFLDSL